VASTAAARSRRGVSGSAVPGRAPPEGGLRLPHVAVELAVAQPRRPRAPARRAAVARRGAVRHGAVAAAPTSASAASGSTSPDDGEHRVRRPVDGPVEAGHVVARQRAQPLLGADAPAADAVLGRGAARRASRPSPPTGCRACAWPPG
jgi:hypothetical protein